jgi:hypothetical protein
MAKSRAAYAFLSQRPNQLDSFDQCRFWLRLEELSNITASAGGKQAIDHLRSSVRKVVDCANWISTQVSRFMPQYTLHEERHFLNVLAIMDALVPDKVIARCGALDCVLPILAAYTHDLGMALSQDEHDRLLDESTEQGKHFATYQSRFDEELRQLERWRKRRAALAGKKDAQSLHELASARKRIDAIEGHILASYLRDTHTEDDQVKRLRRWLDRIKRETGDDNVFRYGVGGKDYQRELGLIGISHGRGAPWLRRQLIAGGPDDRFFQPVATGESANLAFPGLLLRLADVMDFDASRAPRILFKHFGIENDQSVLEWNKHLSIVGWRLDVDPDGKQQPDLLYSAECQHPVHEKAVREFKTWIDAELSAVRIELDAQRRQLPAAVQPRYDLHLPSQTRLDIRAARDPLTDQPKYVFHDLQFRLDQDEIQQLLMGESLYGDPGLCIRELLQNSLDALELRELRLKMKQKGEAREPVDGELIRPGWVREPNGREEELRVTLDWGVDEETGQQWLRVTDNGVGMTEEVIKNYFTQIGKSYYRSPEFNQERAAMKAAGEVVSPISTFGIGILSCYMIADRIEVRTCAGKSKMGCEALDISISSSGSLFWFRQGTLESQGTQIKVYLASGFIVQPNAPEEVRPRGGPLNTYDPAKIDDETNEETKRVERTIDPVRCVTGYFAWPRYPVFLCGPEQPLVRFDDFYWARRFPPDRRAILTKASEWHCPAIAIGEPAWRCFDWNDDKGSTATGSRIRFWFPQSCTTVDHVTMPVDPPICEQLCRQDELAAFVEVQLPFDSHGGTGNGRISVLVRGMAIPLPLSVLPIRAGIGTYIWVDLRGHAAPSLNVTRYHISTSMNIRIWRQALVDLFDRMSTELVLVLQSQNAVTLKNILCGFSWATRDKVCAGATPLRTTVDFRRLCEPSWRLTGIDCLEYTYQRYLQEHIRDFGDNENPFLDLARDRQNHLLTSFRERRLEREVDYELIADRIASAASMLCNQQTEGQWGSAAAELSATLWGGIGCIPVKYVKPFLLSSLLQEAFQPDLSASWCPFEVFPLRGGIGDALLRGPGVVEFEFEHMDNRAVRFGDTHGQSPTELVGRGYDLTFPMTSVPLGQLRRECAMWRSNRWFRPLGVAPFLLPTLHDLWPKFAEFFRAMFKVPHIYCLLPCFDLWSKCFSDWTDADWHNPENHSALWDLSGRLTGEPGQVFWAHGCHHIDEMPKVGLPAAEFLEKHWAKQ